MPRPHSSHGSRHHSRQPADRERSAPHREPSRRLRRRPWEEGKDERELPRETHRHSRNEPYGEDEEMLHINSIGCSRPLEGIDYFPDQRGVDGEHGQEMSNDHGRGGRDHDEGERGIDHGEERSNDRGRDRGAEGGGERGILDIPRGILSIDKGNKFQYKYSNCKGKKKALLVGPLFSNRLQVTAGYI